MAVHEARMEWRYKLLTRKAGRKRPLWKTWSQMERVKFKTILKGTFRECVALCYLVQGLFVRYYIKRNEPAVSAENLLIFTVTLYSQKAFSPWGLLIIQLVCLSLVSSSGWGLFTCSKVAVSVSKPQYPYQTWA